MTAQVVSEVTRRTNAYLSFLRLSAAHPGEVNSDQIVIVGTEAAKGTDFRGQLHLLDALREQRNAVAIALRDSIKFTNPELSSRLLYMKKFFDNLDQRIGPSFDRTTETNSIIRAVVLDKSYAESDKAGHDKKDLLQSVLGVGISDFGFLNSGIRVKSLVQAGKGIFSKLAEGFCGDLHSEQDIYKLLQDTLPPIPKDESSPLDFGGINLYKEDCVGFEDLVLKVFGIK